MKSCEEMVNSLLERREAYELRQKKKRKTLTMALALFCVVCLATASCVGMWMGGAFGKKPVIPVQEGADTGDEKSSIKETFREESKEPDKPFATDTPETVAGREPATEPDGEDLTDFIGVIVIDGVDYVQFHPFDKVYTPDAFLGEATDFEGTYKSYSVGVDAKLYTTKESADVLIVKLGNGGSITLRKNTAHNWMPVYDEDNMVLS